MTELEKTEKDVVIFKEEPDSAQTKEEAYNPETGEINWDCPCIAPMVQPPCGEKFKEAFSCFVYSKEEPKGSDCIDMFREMQTCFQAHPEVYGDLATGEDEDDEDDEEESQESESEATKAPGDIQHSSVTSSQ